MIEPTTTIRPALAENAGRMRDIERAAGRMFVEIGMPDVAEHEPMPADRLGEYARAGRAWLAIDDRGVAVGYALADVVDGGAHLEQVSVDPEFARRGIGGALVERVCGWAAGTGWTAVTLSTFRDVPWNAPYYRRLGFRDLDDEELGPGLVDLRRQEGEHGLDTGARLFMRRDLSRADPAGSPRSSRRAV